MSYQMKIPDEMRAKYIERRQRDLEELKQALGAGNLEPFQRIGHQLKGNGATYGYDELGELGRRMEEAGNAKDSSVAEECLSKFIRWISDHTK
jgi:HPt (histidine-containing phosphotransfer) domain-containing protein